MTPPQNPVGPYLQVPSLCPRLRAELIAEIERAPTALRHAIAGLTESQMNTRYRNWTIRQIVHHLADSHVNSYIRFKWTLTEERPTIKAYDESRWAALDDSRTGAVSAPLALFEALHTRWVQLMKLMSAELFARSFLHPELGEVVTLDAALGYYAWHGRHHTGQILWLREQNRW